MKKHLYVVVFAFALFLTSTSNQLFARAKVPVDSAASVNAARINQIQQRLDEIKAMDKSALTRTARRELRHEAREMRAEVESVKAHRAMYVSVGGVLLVVAILIFVL